MYIVNNINNFQGGGADRKIRGNRRDVDLKCLIEFLMIHLYKILNTYSKMNF